MKRYRNLSGKSGVAAYDAAPGRIVVVFREGERYTYTDASAGARQVALMQELARAGRGLCTFIAREKPGFVRDT
ncbi:MAG: hypothetical protein EOO30_18905 [Comamonadaceae bacterium]|nr:MAG: hypothetical protein EOO30_18905 [Comamonadaceae bacterium]